MELESDDVGAMRGGTRLPLPTIRISAQFQNYDVMKERGRSGCNVRVFKSNNIQAFDINQNRVWE